MPYSEADTRANLIDPALKRSGWESRHLRREYPFTAGRKLYGGKNGERCFLDYLLLYNNLFIGLIEAKSSGKHPTEGLQQAIGYAQKLTLRFIFSTNGTQIYEFDCEKGKGRFIEAFPTPEELYNRVAGSGDTRKAELLKMPLHLSGSRKPRYYQELAVQKVIAGIAEGESGCC